MKKTITVITCDWCKKEVDNTRTLELDGTGFDVCQVCCREIVGRLTNVVEKPATRKKGSKELAVENKPIDIPMPCRLSHELILPILKERAWDMRDARTANMVDRALLDCAGEYDTKEAAVSTFMARCSQLIYIEDSVKTEDAHGDSF